MTCKRLMIGYFYLMTLFIAVVVRAEKPSLKLNPVVGQFVQNYCVNCHNDKKTKADVRLDKLETVIDNPATAQLWQDVLDVINVGDMPPEDSRKKPTGESLSNMIGALTEDLVNARKLLSDQGSEVVLRRLNEAEYINSLEMITGIRVPENMVPDDENGLHFDTLGWYQTFSPVMLNQYQEAAAYALRLILLDGGKPYLKTEVRRRDDARKNYRSKQQFFVREEALYKKALSVPKGTKDFRPYGFRNIDDYKKNLKKPMDRFGAMAVKHYLSNPNTKTGVVIYEANMGPLRKQVEIKPDFRASYIVRARLGVEAGMPEAQRFLQVRLTDELHSYQYLSGTVDKPQILKLELPPRSQRYTVRLEIRNQFTVRKQNSKAMNRGERVPGIWFDWIELEGPIYSGKFKRIRKELLQSYTDESITEPVALEIINAFAIRVFRGRKVTGDFKRRLLQVYRNELLKGTSAVEALIKPMALILSSPKFLYVGPEKTAEAVEFRRISSSDLAHRLSFMLWKQPAEPWLERLLHSDQSANALEAAVDRMMTDPRFDRYINAFFEHWLTLGRMDQIVFDKDAFGADKRHVARAQVYAFARMLVYNDLSLLNLIDSDFTVSNSLLASYLPELGKTMNSVPGNDFVRVNLSARNRHRGGLLGMIAIHAMGSTGERSAPVERGAYILRHFLNDPPPPPPPNVPQLDEDRKGLSLRDRIEMHKTIPQCYSCHRKFDDMGLAMENFDAFGQWRRAYPAYKPSRAELRKANKNGAIAPKSHPAIAIKTHGRMPEGAAFKDFAGMKTHLMKHKDRMIESMAEAMIASGLNRESGFTDQALIQTMVQKTKGSGYKFRTLLKTFILSENFRK